MTMLHRAFAFDHSAFERELKPLLLRALESNDGAELASWIEAHKASLTDPYEGEPLTDSWRDALEHGDVQELGDVALTKFYDGDLDLGLDADWEDIGELLEQSGAPTTSLLGTPLGTDDQPFDPGEQGSYFQTAAEVARGLSELKALIRAKPALAEELAPLLGMLQQAARHERGLYVTF